MIKCQQQQKNQGQDKIRLADHTVSSNMRQRKTDDSVAGYFVTPGNGSIDRQYIIVIVIIKSSDGIITATEIQNIKIFDGFCFRRRIYCSEVIRTRHQW